MVKCPACQEDVDVEFGMVNCANCDAVFMVDFEGNIQHGVEVPETPEATSLEQLPDDSVEDLIESPEVFSSTDNMDENAAESLGSSEDQFMSFDEAEVDSQYLEDTSLEEPQENATETSDFTDDGEEDVFSENMISDDPQDTSVGESDEEEYNEDFMSGFTSDSELEPDSATGSATVDADSTGAEDSSGVENSGLDVSQFDSSKVSQLPDGELYYDVHIQNLDTADIKKLTLRALSDERMGFVLEDLVGDINNGSLILSQLNPAKAIMVIKALEGIDIGITWEQKHYTQVENLDEDE